MDDVALLEDESGFWRRLFRRRTSKSTRRIKRNRAPPPAPMPIIAVAVMKLAYIKIKRCETHMIGAARLCNSDQWSPMNTPNCRSTLSVQAQHTRKPDHIAHY